MIDTTIISSMMVNPRLALGRIVFRSMCTIVVARIDGRKSADLRAGASFSP